MEFIGRNKKISISQINLKDFFVFYKTLICPYIFSYTLEDSTEIIVSFEENHFSHLLGLHKFKKIKTYKYSNDINKDIEGEHITLKLLKENEPKILTTELKDRLTYFPVLKTLLENTTSALKYDLNVVWNSKIEFSFLLRSDKITIFIYLAVKEIKGKKKICVPVSLLVDRNERFLKMGLKELKVISSKILNK